MRMMIIIPSDELNFQFYGNLNKFVTIADITFDRLKSLFVLIDLSLGWLFSNVRPLNLRCRPWCWRLRSESV